MRLSLSLCHPTHIPQLHLNLTGATNKEFYEFVTDFFETDTVTGAQKAPVKLLEWWNKYVSDSTIIPTTTDTECSQSGVSEVHGHMCSRTQVNTTSITYDPVTTVPGHLSSNPFS